MTRYGVNITRKALKKLNKLDPHSRNRVLEEIATLPLPIGGAKTITTMTTAKTTTTTQTPITTTAQPSETTGAHKAPEKASNNLLLLTAVALAIVAIAVAIAVLKRK